MRFQAPSYHSRSTLAGIGAKERNKVSAGGSNSIALTWLAKEEKKSQWVRIDKKVAA